MSNILTTNLPKKIRINGNLYDINYDYRTVINILIAFEDENLTQYEKLYIMVKNLYKDDISDDEFAEACEKAIRFIDCDKKYTTKTSDKRIYSFEKDGGYIFSGINSTHHIDIEEKRDLHWWKFMDFFMDMNPDCMFGEITYYRTRKNEGKLTDEEKKQYRKIKDIIDLEDSKPREQSEARKQFFEEFYKK
jgi:hypothetical protein